jgi:hypothetical protein
MNRRGFLTVLGLAPVVGVMAARDAVAAERPKVRGDAALMVQKLRAGYMTRDEVRAADLAEIEFLTRRRFSADEIAKWYSITPSLLDEPGVAI